MKNIKISQPPKGKILIVEIVGFSVIEHVQILLEGG